MIQKFEKLFSIDGQYSNSYHSSHMKNQCKEWDTPVEVAACYVVCICAPAAGAATANILGHEES